MQTTRWSPLYGLSFVLLAAGCGRCTAEEEPGPSTAVTATSPESSTAVTATSPESSAAPSLRRRDLRSFGEETKFGPAGRRVPRYKQLPPMIPPAATSSDSSP